MGTLTPIQHNTNSDHMVMKIDKGKLTQPSTFLLERVSTISLSFWLSWFLDIVSEANVTRGHGLESQPPLV